MKRFFVLFLILLLVLSLALSVSADEVTSDSTTEESMQDSEAVMEEETVGTKEETQTDASEGVVDESEESIDFDAYAEQFVGYIFSGSAASDELLDKIIDMGAQYQLAKEQGYTLEERLNQLLTPDNILTTIAAVFLVICGVAFFVFRHKQKIDTARIHVDLVAWKKKYEEETKTNQKLREDIEHQSTEIHELKEMVVALTERSDISKQDLAHVEHTAVAVAKMVKDVFLNSKTIDASGKSLLVHNYVEALGATEQPTKESDDE